MPISPACAYLASISLITCLHACLPACLINAVELFQQAQRVLAEERQVQESSQETVAATDGPSQAVGSDPVTQLQSSKTAGAQVERAAAPGLAPPRGPSAMTQDEQMAFFQNMRART